MNRSTESTQSMNHLDSPNDQIVNRTQIIDLLEKYGWKKKLLQEPEVVYQASLRLGMSFEQTILTFFRLNLISNQSCDKLLNVNPSDIKHKLIKKHIPENIKFGDVWHLTEYDDEIDMYVGENDLFLFELNEIPSTGYIWNFDQINKKEFKILSDTRVPHSKGTVGSPVTRHILLKIRKRHCQKEVQFKKQRPWDREDFVKTLTFHYNTKINK